MESNTRCHNYGKDDDNDNELQMYRREGWGTKRDPSGERERERATDKQTHAYLVKVDHKRLGFGLIGAISCQAPK